MSKHRPLRNLNLLPDESSLKPSNEQELAGMRAPGPLASHVQRMQRAKIDSRMRQHILGTAAPELTDDTFVPKS